MKEKTEEKAVERYFCSLCNEEHSREALFEFNEEFLCSNCLDNETVVCNCCGDRIWTNDSYGDSDISLCQDCYNEYYTRCDDCNGIVANDDVYYFDDDDDTPFCRNCFERRENNNHIHDYSYKPEPIFYGNSNRYFGVELEIDEGGKDNYNAEQIENTANINAENVYIKSDGSLDCGLEIVTHPMSLEYHINNMPWADVARKALNLGYKSHRTGTCGLHCHVNRESLGEDIEEQEQAISRVLFLVERFWQELLKFSRRTESQIARWAARYGFKNEPKAILETAKKGYGGRYTCVNISNYKTIEFRIFRGTLKYNTIIATLQLVNEICEVAILMSDDEVSSLSWPAFVERIDVKTNIELVRYLKERRLYINEPIESLEEDCECVVC